MAWSQQPHQQNNINHSKPEPSAPTYLSNDPFPLPHQADADPDNRSLYPSDSASQYGDRPPPSHFHSQLGAGAAHSTEPDRRTPSEQVYQDPYAPSYSHPSHHDSHSHSHSNPFADSQTHVPLIQPPSIFRPHNPRTGSELSDSTIDFHEQQRAAGGLGLGGAGPGGSTHHLQEEEGGGWKSFRDDYPSSASIAYGGGGYDSDPARASSKLYGDLNPSGGVSLDAIKAEDSTYPPPPPSHPKSRFNPLSAIVGAKSGGGAAPGDQGTSYRRPPLWRRWLRDPTPLDRKVEEYKRGIGVQNRAWGCWALALACGVAFIVELANNWKAQGSPISTKPYFNYMIGPSAYVLINSGARFVPCMKDVPEISNLPFACLNETSATPTVTCSLNEICGFGLQAGQTPDQSFRFFVPVFLHAGIIHILLNLLALSTSSALIERLMGTPRFLLIFIPAGIFGFILGGNFALVGLPSVGASGAIFGTHAAITVDLVSHWKLTDRPGRKMIFLMVEIIIGFAIGFIPFAIDNFSHIGGFLMGLLLSIILLPSIHNTHRHRLIIYSLRALSAALVIVLFVVLTRNFYVSDPNQACEWCRYLSCLPTAANNRCKGTGLTITNTNADGSTTTSQVGSRGLGLGSAVSPLYALPNLVWQVLSVGVGLTAGGRAWKWREGRRGVKEE